ncbi:MFS transporter [Corynebacterium kozikiae]|uniref:MFS transporter n=1 Tax=Corynebacterium kozikiae TaxID=2968469 RepID=UPI00211C49EA|nr:MFS transporter [Corynebacterium sp. 76QC2CO]MCQ9344273.1 MFS transporter [Corynebacterium sp. 76QC2CO]
MRTSPTTAWLYLASAGLSMFGNSVAGIVWPWLVLERTGNPQAAAIVAAAIAIPSLIFAYYGGNLIDSLGRKPMSVASDIISGSSVVGVIMVDQITELNLTWFIILGIVGALGDIPGMSARAALIGDVAKASGRTIAQLSGINQAIMGISFLAGPALAGFLLAALDITQVLWITAGCSLAAAALTAMLRLHSHSSEGVEGTRSGGSLSDGTAPADAALDSAAVAGSGAVTTPAGAPGVDSPSLDGFAGWKKALSFPVMRLLALDSLLAMMLVVPYLSVLMPAHFQQAGAPHLLGMAMSGYAVGMMIAGIAATRLVKHERLTWIVGMTFYILGFGFMGWLENSIAVIAGMVVAGLGGGVLNPLQTVLVTETVPEEIRGRAFSIFMAISQVAGPIGLAATSLFLGFSSIYQIAVALAVLWFFAAVFLIVWGLRVLPAKSAA